MTDDTGAPPTTALDRVARVPALDLVWVPPAGWRLVDRRLDGARWVDHRGRKSVILSVEHWDDVAWLHGSIACTQMPRYCDLQFLKEHWFGPELDAVMVLPRASQHVNIHPTCLHLFACLEGHPLPDFGQHGII